MSASAQESKRARQSNGLALFSALCTLYMPCSFVLQWRIIFDELIPSDGRTWGIVIFFLVYSSLAAPLIALVLGIIFLAKSSDRPKSLVGKILAGWGIVLGALEVALFLIFMLISYAV